MIKILIGIIFGISWGIINFPTYFKYIYLEKLYDNKCLSKIEKLQKIYDKTQDAETLKELVKTYTFKELQIYLIELGILIVLSIIIYYILVLTYTKIDRKIKSKRKVQGKNNNEDKLNLKTNIKTNIKINLKIIIIIALLTNIFLIINNMYIEKIYILDNVIQTKRSSEKIIKFVPKSTKKKDTVKEKEKVKNKEKNKDKNTNTNNINNTNNLYVEEDEYISQNYLKDDILGWKQKYKREETSELGKGKYIVYFLDKKENINNKNINNISNSKNNKKEKPKGKNTYTVALLNSNTKNIYRDLYLEIQSKKDYELGKKYTVTGRLEKYDFQRNFKGYNLRYAKYSKNIYFKIIDHNDYIFKENEKGYIDKNNFNLLTFKYNIVYKILDYKSKFKIGIEKRFKNSSLILGLVIADTSRISENTKEEFKNINIYHILAVSGTHLGYLILILSTISKKTKMGKIFKNAIYIAIILPFIYIVGFSSSVLRAGGIVILKSIFDLLNIKVDFKYLITCILSIILILRPYKIVDVGMYLSFLGAIGIVYSNVLFKKYKEYSIKVFEDEKEKERKIARKKEGEKERLNKINIYIMYLKYKRNLEILKGKITVKIIYIIVSILEKIVDIIISTLFSSVVVFIIILPVMWYNFGVINLNFVIANIFLLPIFAILIILGLVYLMFYWIIFPVEKYIFGMKILNILWSSIDKIIDGILIVISKLQSYNFLNIIKAAPSILTLSIYYILIILIYIKLCSKYSVDKLCIDERKTEKEISKVKQKKKISSLIIIALIIAIILSNYCLSSLKNNQISFVDIGQGDASVISTKDGKNIVIDTGEGESPRYPAGKKILYPYLLKRGIDKIDYLVISHFDSDHSGGAKTLLENLKVKNLIICRQSKISKQYLLVEKTARENGTRIIYVKKGDRFKVGKYVDIKVLFPEVNQIRENPLNNNSVVLMVNVKNSFGGKNTKTNTNTNTNTNKYNIIKQKEVVLTNNYEKILKSTKIKKVYKDLKILYTGDVEKIAEDKIGDEILKKEKIDILKAPHHGSNSSSTIRFLNHFDINSFVISCGKNNTFSHPSKVVLKRYEEIIKNANNQKREKQIQLLSEISRTDREGEIMYIN